MFLPFDIALSSLTSKNLSSSRDVLLLCVKTDPFKDNNTYNYNYVLDNLKLHTLFKRQVLFTRMRNIYNGFIACPSFLETLCESSSRKHYRLTYFQLCFHIVYVLLAVT
jgi:hypothetical protein